MDAEEQAAEAEKRAARMHATASVIRRMIADGEPWPSDTDLTIPTIAIRNSDSTGARSELTVGYEKRRI